MKQEQTAQAVVQAEEQAMIDLWYEWVEGIEDVMPWYDRYADEVRALMARGLSMQDAIEVVADAN